MKDKPYLRWEDLKIGLFVIVADPREREQEGYTDSYDEGERNGWQAKPYFQPSGTPKRIDGLSFPFVLVVDADNPMQCGSIDFSRYQIVKAEESYVAAVISHHAFNWKRFREYMQSCVYEMQQIALKDKVKQGEDSVFHRVCPHCSRESSFYVEDGKTIAYCHSCREVLGEFQFLETIRMKETE